MDSETLPCIVSMRGAAVLAMEARVSIRRRKAPRPPTSLLTAVIDQARQGDQESLDIIYRNHVGVVYGYLRACGIQDAEDLTSEVFIGVLRGLDSFKGGPSEFRTWLMTIAYRRMVDYRRRQSSDRSVSQEPEKISSLAPATQFDAFGVEIDPRLIAAFTTLTIAQKEVVALRFVADLGLERVAQITGRPVGAVKSLQHRGLATLRNALANEGFSGEVVIR